MRNYVNAQLRRYVAERAGYICEYCLIHEEDTYFGCEVDHIISVKHEGKTAADNLAFACAFCNRHKGSDIGSIYWPTGELVRFFNPRIDYWSNHFRLDGILISSVVFLIFISTEQAKQWILGVKTAFLACFLPQK